MSTNRKAISLLLLSLVGIATVSYLALTMFGGITGGAPGTSCMLSSVQKISLPPGPGRIDHMDVDVARGRLYVAMLANNSLAVVDLNQGSFLRSVTGLKTPQGVLFSPSANRLLVSNGGDGTVDILNATTLEIMKVVQLSSDADNMRQDQGSGIVYVGYGNGGIASLNAITGQVLGSVSLVGHPESFQLDRNDSRLFANIPEGPYIAVIDRTNLSVVARWPLPVNFSMNFPMALDEIHHRLFVGTRQPAEVLVYDDLSGQLVTTVGIAQGADDIYYSNGCIYASSREGYAYVMKQDDPNHYEVVQTIPTGVGAGTSFFVSQTNRFYIAVPQSSESPPQVYIYKH